MHRTAAKLSVSLVSVAALASVGLDVRPSASSPRQLGANPRPCDRVINPNANPRRFVRSLKRGQTGCLRARTYRLGPRPLKLTRPGITLTSYRVKRATIVGRLWVGPKADRTTIRHLRLNGRNPDRYVSPLIHADQVVLRNNEITNHGTAVCITIDDFPGHPAPQGVVIGSNRIHGCGTPGTNRQHGIYVADARFTLIRNNWIHDNADRGIQLYPNADATLVTGNVIDANGEGVIFGGDGSESSDGNLVEHNVITNSTIRHNVESSWGGPVGTGNLLRDNCVFGGAQGSSAGGIQAPAVGFSISANTIANPRYVNRRARDYRMRRGSQCAAVLARAPHPPTHVR